jgi:lipopolysaccharide transport system permease protein
MLAWFFLTPVIYDPSRVVDNFPEWVHYLFFANPMTGIVTSYRMALLGADNPGLHLLGLSFACAWLLLAAGILVFQGFQGRFGDEL